MFTLISFDHDTQCHLGRFTWQSQTRNSNDMQCNSTLKVYLHYEDHTHMSMVVYEIDFRLRLKDYQTHCSMSIR